ncbi:hypothetical protein F5X98DRAFT_206235 [Xylaria grammica]|nr:hypothetical protein F5X98DRAFT_206235 [Xylaria grammica]
MPRSYPSLQSSGLADIVSRNECIFDHKCILNHIKVRKINPLYPLSMADAAQADDLSLVQLYFGCIDSFAKLVTALSEPDCDVIRRNEVRLSQVLEEYGRTKIWGDQSKADLPARARGSLDDTLRHDNDLKSLVRGILQRLGMLLQQVIHISQRKYDPGREMDQDSISSVTDSDYSTENDDESERRKMPKICLYFKQIVEQIGSLHEISSLLRRPTVTNKFIRSMNLGLEATTLQGSGTVDLNSAFGIFDNSHILEKVTQWRGLGKSLQSVVLSNEAVALVSDTLDYPEVRDIRWFCQRLARANTRRREQLQYWKTHPYDPTQMTISANSIADVHVAQVEDSRSQVSTLKPSNPHVSHEGPKSIVSKQSFSTVAVSDVHDAGTNIRPRTVYAPTVTSKDRPISIPRPPKTKDGETTFPCPYCGMKLGDKNMTRQLWKRHVFRDLRPYICTFEHCHNAGKLFPSRHEWQHHEFQIHRREYVCQRCRNRYTSRKDMLTHLQGHYGDSIPPDQMDIILDLCDRQVDPSNNHTESCILCGKECPLSEWHDHVAAHMEDLSIFVLPAPEDDEGQAEGSVISGGADVLGSNDDCTSSVSKASSLGFSEAGDHGQIPTEFAKIFADKEPGYASKFPAWNATSEDKHQRPLDSIFDPDSPPDLGEAMGGQQKVEDEKRESQLNAKSEKYGYSNDNNIQNDQTVPSPSELSTKWPLDRVLSWLAANGFSKDWQETFKTLNLHGDDFLDLGGAYGGRGNFAKMHQVIFPQLALECGRSGTGWDQSHQREEGKRIRRLIRYLAAGKLPESSKMQQSQDSTEILPKPAASGGLSAMIKEVVNSYNLDWWELESFLNRIYPTTSFEEHTLLAAGDHYLIYVPRPLTSEERGEIDEIRKQHWVRENSTAGRATKEAVTTRQTDKMRGNALLEEDRVEQALKMTEDPETTHVNVMLDDLEKAKKRFDEQEKKQQGVEWSEGSTRHSRPLSQQALAGDEGGKISESVRERERDKEQERTRKLSRNMKAAIQYLTAASAVADGSRGVPEPPAIAGSGEGGGASGSSSDDEVRYEPPLPRKTRFTNATQGVEFEERKTPLKRRVIYDEVYGLVPAPPSRPPAITDGITGKRPGAGLSFSRIGAWICSVEEPSPATSSLKY